MRKDLSKTEEAQTIDGKIINVTTTKHKTSVHQKITLKE